MKKVTNKEIADHIEIEGFDYALRSYFIVLDFKDPKMKELGLKYCEVSNEIIDYLKKKVKGCELL